MTIVQLLRAEAGSTATTRGDLSHFANFEVAVSNLAFEKEVDIWGHDTRSDTWRFYPCTFSRQVPGEKEIWSTQITGIHIDIFDVSYRVLDRQFWDNNRGHNYHFSTGNTRAERVGSVVMGTDLLVREWSLTNDSLLVDIIVRTLGPQQKVAIVQTSGNWSTLTNAFGTFERTFPPLTIPHQPATQLWHVSAPVGQTAHGQFSGFCIADNRLTWDNNFGVNYSY